ncbi:MAG: family 16 glycosylhydrolase [Rhodopila sp.]
MANDTTVTTPSGTIVDSKHNMWSLKSSTTKGIQVVENGIVDQRTKNVQELVYVNHNLYYENISDNWFELINNNWTAISDPLLATPFLPSTPSGPIPPPQAVAAGYTTATFNDDFTDPNDISADNTGVHNWYLHNGFDTNNKYGANLTPSDYTVSNGMLTMLDTNGYPGLNTVNTNHPAISTPTSHASNTGSGLAFQYGYFEASIKFDPSYGSLGPSEGWPSFWASAVQAYNGINPYAELDFMEAYPTPGNNPPVTLSGTVHQWLTGTSGYQNTNNGMPLPKGINMNSFNTYGCLWAPTNITWYINNQVIMSVPTATATLTSTGTNTFSAANASQMYLQLGTGHNWPMQVNWVHVFQ